VVVGILTYLMQNFSFFASRIAGMERIALNEWLLAGWRTDDLNGRLWALAECPLSGCQPDAANVRLWWKADIGGDPVRDWEVARVLQDDLRFSPTSSDDGTRV
jgi:hypothetical protein